jgi:hypothetical protein
LDADPARSPSFFCGTERRIAPKFYGSLQHIANGSTLPTVHYIAHYGKYVFRFSTLSDWQ